MKDFLSSSIFSFVRHKIVIRIFLTGIFFFLFSAVGLASIPNSGSLYPQWMKKMFVELPTGDTGFEQELANPTVRQSHTLVDENKTVVVKGVTGTKGQAELLIGDTEFVSGDTVKVAGDDAGVQITATNGNPEISLGDTNGSHASLYYDVESSQMRVWTGKTTEENILEGQNALEISPTGVHFPEKLQANGSDVVTVFTCAAGTGLLVGFDENAQPLCSNDTRKSISWVRVPKPGAAGVCSKTCGGGTVEYNVYCRNSERVAGDEREDEDYAYRNQVNDSVCTDLGLTAPSSTEFCNEQACQPEIIVSCGSATDQNWYTAPNDNLCEVGTPNWDDKTAADTTFNWRCTGLKATETISCETEKKADGQCGSTQDDCSIGNFVDGTDSADTYKWTCSGVRGGNTSPECSSLKSVDATWSNWANSGQCDAATGKIPQTRTCGGELYGGNASCAGLDGGNDTRTVNCDVDGGWTDWEDTGSCSAGNKPQKRSCTNPTPLNGGLECDGNTTQSVRCTECGTADGSQLSENPLLAYNEPEDICATGEIDWIDSTANDGTWNWRCTENGVENPAECSANVRQINGGWSNWSNTGSCSAGKQQQTRSCNNPTPAGGGADCSGIDGGNNTQEINCNFSPWNESGWSACSNTCGDGTQTQTVSCSTGNEVDCDPSTKPQTSQICTGTSSCVVTPTYSWNYGNYSGCDSSCESSDGYEYRSVWCEDDSGNTVNDSNCSDPYKPDTYQGCHNYNSCAVTCTSEQHEENGSCVSNTQSCPISNGTGTQNWSFDRDDWHDCWANSCNTNYHLSGGSCVSNTQSCNVSNGTGSQTWNAGSNSWGSCTATSCDSNYHIADSSEGDPEDSDGTCTPSSRWCSPENAPLRTGTRYWTNYSKWTAGCIASECNTGYELSSGDCVVSNTASRYSGNGCTGGPYGYTGSANDARRVITKDINGNTVSGPYCQLGYSPLSGSLRPQSWSTTSY